MAVFNRNILTEPDVQKYAAYLDDPEKVKPPQSMAAAPPAGLPQGAASDTPIPPAKPDDYLAKLVKYIPAEVFAAYLYFSSVVKDNVADDKEQQWLGWLLLIMAAVTAAYVRKVLGVIRFEQVMLSVVALVVYAYTVGDWFQSFDFYYAWTAGPVLVAFGLALAFVKVRPLPEAPAGDLPSH